MKLDWDEFNCPMGKHSSEFARECGIIVRYRDNAPLQVTNWKAISDFKKQKMMSLIMVIYIFNLFKLKTL